MATEIKYKNKTIHVEAGKTIALHTAHQGLTGDIIIKADDAIPNPVLQEKTVTENGEVTPDAGYDGLSKVTVNVAGEVIEEYDGTVVVE